MTDPHRILLLKTLRLLAPGTPLREGLDHILNARTGALIVLADPERIEPLVDGGFQIDAELTPARLYELAKMDGAIIVSEDSRRIRFANVQILPEPSIPSTETGIRHRTAERTARQTGGLIVAVSQRRNLISVFRGDMKYVLREVGLVLAKANQAIQTLERYRSSWLTAIAALTTYEFEELVTLGDVALALQRAELVLRVAEEIELQIAELGEEGRLIGLQLHELVAGVAEEERAVVRDYVSVERGADNALASLGEIPLDNLFDLTTTLRAIGFSGQSIDADQLVVPRGYRVLRKIPRLPAAVVDNVVGRFSHLHRILQATVEDLDAVEGIGEVRARAIHDGLLRLRDQASQRL